VARGVGRSYRGVRALSDVDLELRRGQSVALLGPNGAGKTTLLTILAGVGRASSGTLAWAEDVAPRVGWVPQRPALYQRLSVRENLRLFAALEKRGDPAAAADALIARADLGAMADQIAARLSTGTLQRLNLAIALAGRPSVLLLDEPTATLSPDQRLRLWRWLDELRADEGMAVLFSTQSVDEAQRRGDRLVVLVGGRLAFSGTPEEMLAAHAAGAQGGAEVAERAFMHLLEQSV
jgi:ABC-type multidrug transport system ATPase subunit